MSETPPEDGPTTADERLHAALLGFTGCIGEALENVCSYGLIAGEAYSPFDPDPEDNCGELDDETMLCTQAWVRMVSAGIAYQQDSFAPGECGGVYRLELEVGIIRCIEVEAEGEAPKAADLMVAALQSVTDMNSIYCAAMNCEVWDSITSGLWAPFGPLGGQYGGTWTFTVEL